MSNCNLIAQMQMQRRYTVVNHPQSNQRAPQARLNNYYLIRLARTTFLLNGDMIAFSIGLKYIGN